MYYIKVFGRMLQLENKKVGRNISRPETLRAAKANVNKYFPNLQDKSIYIVSQYSKYGHAIEYKKVL